MSEIPREELLDVIDAVFAVNGGLVRAGDAMGQQFGITAAQWQVLGLLEHGPDTVSGVARRRGLRRQSVRDTVQRLERSGLVERRPNPDDRRAPLLVMTPAGAQALARASGATPEWLADLARDLRRDEVLAALAVLRTLRARLGVPARDTPHTEGISR